MVSQISFPGTNTGIQIGINNAPFGITDPLDDLPIAVGAVFDSFDNQNQDECLPGTRVHLLAQIAEWATSPNQKSIFWLHGMAGTGKSSIARTLARDFKEAKMLGASFFFKRGEEGRGDARRFITTIVRQLADSIPGLAPLVQQSINNDKNIATKGLKEQFDRIFLDPLRELKPPTSPVPHIYVAIVIDALDECTDNANIRLILQQLPRLQEIKAFRIRVFLTSRPEWPILQGFSDRVLTDQYSEVILHQLRENVIKDDIALFLKHRLQAIRTLRQLPPDWPGNIAIDNLAEISVPLFIFAATVCRIFEDIRWDPYEALNEILSHESDASLLESIYDPIFTRILEGQHTKKKSKLVRNCLEIIGPIVLLESPLSVTSLAKFLGLPESKINAQLALLRPVLDIPDGNTLPIRLFHLSLRDFLLEAPSEPVGRPFWVDESETQKKLAERCLETCENLRRNICNLSDDTTRRIEIEDQVIIACIPPEVQYACRYWVHHLVHSDEKHTLRLKVLSFLEKHFLHWIELMSILGLVFDAVEMVHQLQMVTEAHDFSTLAHFLLDAHRFILKNHQIADDAPLQIYSAGLLFTPQNSIIRQKFKSEIPTWALQLSGSDDRWGPELQTLDSHTDAVNAVAFSPNGRLLASASDDHTVILWDPRTGAIQQRFTDPDYYWTQSVAFSHDSRLVAAGFQDNKVRVWDITTSDLLFTLQESETVCTVAFSPKEQLLATGIGDNTVTLWNIENGTLRKSLTGHSKTVRTVAFSPDGMMLASGSDDHTTRLWDLAGDSFICILKGNPKSIRSVAFSSDGQLLACGSKNTIEIWDTERHEISQTFKCSLGHGYVNCVVFSPSNLSLASCTNEVQIWDIRKGCFQQTLIGHSSSVNSVAFSPNGQILASGSADRSLRLWDIKVTLNDNPSENSTMIKNLAFSPNSELLASVTHDNTVRLYSAATGILKHTLVGHTALVSSVAFSPDGKQLASGSEDKTIRLWDLATGLLEGIFEAHSEHVSLLVFSQDGQQLASGSADMTIRLWDIATGANKHIFESQPHPQYIAFSPCGQLLAANGVRGRLHVWNVTTGTLNFDGKNGPAFCDNPVAAAFSPNSQLIASYVREGKLIKLEDSTTGILQEILFTSERNAETPDFGNISYVSKKLESCKLSVRNGKILFQPPNRSLSIWLTEDSWLILNDRKILRLPADAKPCRSALKLDQVALGYPSGRISLMKLDVHNLTGGNLACSEVQECLNEVNTQLNLQDNLQSHYY